MYPGPFPCTSKMNVYSVDFGMKCTIHIKCIWSSMSFSIHISFLIFCLDDPLTDVSGVLKFSTISVFLPLVLLIFTSHIKVLLCQVHKYLQMLLYFLVGLTPFIIMQCPSLPVIIVFVVKSIFVCSRYSYPHFVLFSILLDNFSILHFYSVSSHMRSLL